MEKRYISLSTWVDKNSNLPKSLLAEVKGGKNKAGSTYEITDSDNKIIVDEYFPVGKIICYTMTMNTEPISKTTTPRV